MLCKLDALGSALVKPTIALILNSPGEFNLANSILPKLIERGNVIIITHTENDKLIKRYMPSYSLPHIFYTNNKDIQHNLPIKVNAIDMIITGLLHERNLKVMSIIKTANPNLASTVGLIDFTPPTQKGNRDLIKNFYDNLLSCNRIITTSAHVQEVMPKYYAEYIIMQTKNLAKSLGLIVIQKNQELIIKNSKEEELAKINLEKMEITTSNDTPKYQNLLERLSELVQKPFPEILYGTDPRLNETANKIKTTSVQNIKNGIGIKEEDTVLGFISQPVHSNPTQENILHIISKAAAEIAKNKRVHILILPHPRENIQEPKEEYTAALQKIRDQEFSGIIGTYSSVVLQNSEKINITTFKLYLLLQEIKKEISKNPALAGKITVEVIADTIKGCAASTVLLTETSTLGVETLYTGIPTIFLAPPGESYDLEVIKNGLAPTAFNGQELCSLISKLSDNYSFDINKLPSDANIFTESIFSSPRAEQQQVNPSRNNEQP